MGRKKVEIKKSELEAVIKEVESNQTFPNRSVLYDAVAETDWAKNHKDNITPSVIALRVREFKIELQTKKGKRGGGANLRKARGHKRTSRADKFAQDPAICHSLDVIEDTWGNLRNEPEKIRDGSMKAAVGLKCLDCVGGSTAEVAKCTAYGCPLWPFRQWNGRSKLEKKLNGEIDDDNDDLDDSAMDEEEVEEEATLTV